MEDNIFQALIGGSPTPDRQQLIADQLRRRRSFGELGALTGDRVLQPFGQGLSKQADTYAKELQEARQKDIDNAQTKAYQEGQLKHMQNVEALTKRGQTLDHIYQMLMAQAALQKADNAGTAKPGKLTYADRTKLENMASMVNSAQSVLDTFQPDYAQKFGPGPQSRLPNTLAAVGLSTQGMDEAANWWAQWNLLYSMPQRNATFGATLTPHEKKSWAESDINPSMDAKTIKDRVQNILKIVRNKGGLMNKTYSTQFDPEIIESYGLPGEENVIPPMGSGGHAAVKQPRRIKVDANGNVIGN